MDRKISVNRARGIVLSAVHLATKGKESKDIAAVVAMLKEVSDRYQAVLDRRAVRTETPV